MTKTDPRLMPPDFHPADYEPTVRDLLTLNIGRWVLLNGESPVGLAQSARVVNCAQETETDAIGRKYARWTEKGE